MTRELQVQELISKLKGYRRKSYTPWIMLKGKWMNKAGIEAGQRVQVIVADDHITIRSLRS